MCSTILYVCASLLSYGSSISTQEKQDSNHSEPQFSCYHPWVGMKAKQYVTDFDDRDNVFEQNNSRDKRFIYFSHNYSSFGLSSEKGA